MKEIRLMLDPELGEVSPEKVLELLDEEVKQFERFMQSQAVDWKVRGELLPQERVLLKTYLVQKLRGRVDGA